MLWSRAGEALRRAGRADPTYPEHGATAGPLPDGYRPFRGSWPVGRGKDDFTAAAEAIRTWEMHRGAGLRVLASSDTAEVGTVVVQGVGAGGLRLLAPCRVLEVVDAQRRSGFAYGTLPGHPASGEERFEVVLGDDDVVTLEITSFSRPGTWFARAGGPATHAVQHLVTRRYVRAVRAAVAARAL